MKGTLKAGLLSEIAAAIIKTPDNLPDEVKTTDNLPDEVKKTVPPQFPQKIMIHSNHSSTQKEKAN